MRGACDGPVLKAYRTNHATRIPLLNSARLTHEGVQETKTAASWPIEDKKKRAPAHMWLWA